MAEEGRAAAVDFEGACPILRVQNLAASIEYYVGKLGFMVDWRALGFASVSRGRCHIFLSVGDQGNPGSWVWIGVEDAEKLFAEYLDSGARVRHPPTNYPWAYEMQVEDLDGNILRLGSHQRDEPIGEWLDMRGVRWLQSAAGEWEEIS